MKMPFYFSLILICLVLTACDRPNPNPETIDPIYGDLSKMAEEAKRSLPEIRTAAQEAERELNKAPPQTGQIEYAKKRLREANERLNRAEQMATYLAIRAESRLKYDRETYLKAWQKKLPWPDPAEYAAFKESEQAKFTKPNWDIKARLKAAGVGSPEAKPTKKE